MKYQVQQLITWGETYFPHWATVATYEDLEVAEARCDLKNRMWDSSFRVVTAQELEA